LTDTVIRCLTAIRALAAGEIRGVAGRVASRGEIAFASIPPGGIIGMPCRSGLAGCLEFAMMDFIIHLLGDGGVVVRCCVDDALLPKDADEGGKHDEEGRCG
jgi:hypothetical protein